MEYVKTMGLAGAMVWDISMDNFKGVCGGKRYPFLTAMRDHLATSQDGGTKGKPW